MRWKINGSDEGKGDDSHLGRGGKFGFRWRRVFPQAALLAPAGDYYCIFGFVNLGQLLISFGLDSFRASDFDCASE
jgi:hypothetical protein